MANFTFSARLNNDNNSEPIQLNYTKCCPACQSTTHFSRNSKNCPKNKNAINSNKPCSSCRGTDHSLPSSSLCKYNENFVFPEIARKCVDCNGSDHLNKLSNLCGLNIKYKNKADIVCKYCALIGHARFNSRFCLSNPNRITTNQSSSNVPRQKSQIRSSMKI